MGPVRSRLTYANVMVTILAFIVVGGGTALASFVISSNSQVGPGTISGHRPPGGKHANLISGSVNSADLAAGSVASGELRHPGRVPASIPVTTAGCTDVSNAWATEPGSRLSFYRDVTGRVYLQGIAVACGNPGTNAVFQLPAGFRPNESVATFGVFRLDDESLDTLQIGASGNVSGNTIAPSVKYTFDGISFRCGPSGQNGCP